MANYLPKDREQMRVLARRGGLASGETRRLKRVGRIAAECAHRKWGISPPVIPDDGYLPAVHELWRILGGRYTLEECEEPLRPTDRRGGSHDTDWRCPDCHRFNSTRSRQCRNCKRMLPHNNRATTRAALEAKRRSIGRWVTSGNTGSSA